MIPCRTSQIGTSTVGTDGGLGVKMVFERHIVWPDGRKEIEGVTPKTLPAPDASHVLPSSPDPEMKANNIN
jgi:hypothetical protein